MRSFRRVVGVVIVGVLLTAAFAAGTAFGSSLVFNPSKGSVEERLSRLEDWARRASLEINHWNVHGVPGASDAGEQSSGGGGDGGIDGADGDAPPPDPTPRPKRSCTFRFGGNTTTYEHGESWTWRTEVYGYQWLHTAECRDGRVTTLGSEKVAPIETP